MTPMLPADFVERMKAQLGDTETEALCCALERTPPVVSVRHNLRKAGAKPEGERVPWCAEGRYLAERPSFTLDPAFHAGAYYVQEASSQFVAHIAASCGIEGCRVLDMCAAPGGKTAVYSSLAGDDGLVVANEVNRSRANVLADNVRKWGLGNVVVTAADAACWAAAGGWFDVVAVDAPCSGEGMFRKMPEAREQWSVAAVKACVARQKDILRAAWSALREGGLLIYSTCTFNDEEDEGVLSDFAERHGGELERVDMECPDEWGIVRSSVGAFATFRFMPHRARGEGFFAAVARKAGGASRGSLPRARREAVAAAPKSAAGILSRWVEKPAEMFFADVAGTFYAYRASRAADIKAVSEAFNAIYSGVAMGRIFKGELKPDHALALYAGLRRDAVHAVRLGEEDAQGYLRRGEFSLQDFGQGLNLVVCGDYALGFAKRIGARCNNMYPGALRILQR